jgi:hypothetical protein
MPSTRIEPETSAVKSLHSPDRPPGHRDLLELLTDFKMYNVCGKNVQTWTVALQMELGKLIMSCGSEGGEAR